MIDTVRLPEEGAFVFRLNLVCGGYAYFSVITMWVRHGSGTRTEVRKPSVMMNATVLEALAHLGQKVYVVNSQSLLAHWLLFTGWALVSGPFAHEQMSQWLKEKECVKSAFDTFTDTAIASPSALRRRARPGKRAKIVERDKGVCLLCRRRESDGIKLTTHHVTAHGKGGETTMGNLVTVCEQCHQKLGTNRDTGLYELAGLPHTFDFSLLNGPATKEAIHWARRLSANLMHTRCEVF